MHAYLKTTRLLPLFVSLFAGAVVPSARASEGAASDYFAGAFGSFLVAMPPEPGFGVASQTLLYSGQASRAVINGRATFGINASSNWNPQLRSK